MNETFKFLKKIRSLGIELTLDENKIRCKSPNGALTPEIRAELAKRKEEIVSFFKSLSPEKEVKQTNDLKNERRDSKR